MLHNSHKQVHFWNFRYSSTIQMVWVIFIHVIIEVNGHFPDIKSMLVKTSSFFTIFSFCSCINFGGMAVKLADYLNVKVDNPWYNN